jgi:glycerol kinase
MQTYILAIDQGTTSTRCILFNQNGQIHGLSQAEHTQYYPAPGWVEHDALEILEKTLILIRDLLHKTGLDHSNIAAIGITNQRETTVIWDRHTGQPIHRALVWQDTRTAELCEALRQQSGDDRFRPKTGLPIATYFSGPKIQWLLNHVPGARIRADHGDLLFGTMDTWLIWNLSQGTHVTDPTNASRTLLMDLETLDWDDDLLEAMSVPKSLLPPICSSSEIYAYATGDLKGVPIAGNLGDQQAALFGQTCFDPGDAKNTYGTGCFLLMNTGSVPTPSRHGLLTTVGYRLGDSDPVYALEGSVAVTGSLVQWLRDNLGIIHESHEVEALAKTVDDAGGMYIVPAFSGLFAPHWRSDARGVIVGLTRYIHKGHFARAALEATCYQTREVLEAMTADLGYSLSSLKVDGGMVVNDTLMQFQSDILAVDVIRPTVTETTARGAAFVAGLAVGYWEDMHELRTLWSEDCRFTGKMQESERDQRYQGWNRAVERSFGWIPEN